ncbi:MAG: NUDIX hydrolase [Chloroflexota bacterium]
MSDEQWSVTHSEIAFQHPYVTVELQEVHLPDGRVIPDWPIIHTRDYVNVLTVNEDNQALILEGYKHGLGRSSWQVVGGYLEVGEEPLAAAQRELLEETGYASDDWQPLGSFVVDANRRAGVGHFFLTGRVRLVAAPNYDDLEAFQTRWVSLSELREALGDGRVGAISYAITMALGLLVLRG